MDVEMGVAYRNRTWEIHIVEVPDSIPDDNEIIETHAKAALNEMGLVNMAGCWLHNIPNINSMRMLVACLNSLGEATLVPVKVRYRRDAYDLHDAALKWASKNRYDDPMIGFDETDDLPNSVWECFDWDNAPVVNKEYK